MYIKLLSLGLLSLPIFAGTMGKLQPFHSFPLVASFSIGPVWTNPGQQQLSFNDPETEFFYTATRPTNILADGEVFVGLQTDLPHDFFAHIGVEGALTSKAGLSGQIWDDADPEFNNFIYGYHLQHRHVALKAKLFKDLAYAIYPWISGSIGIGFNRAMNYYLEPILYEAEPRPNFVFSSHTQTSFTYTAGAGLQKILTEHWQVGLGYEFADWGKNHLGRNQEQTDGTGLSVNHVYTNGILFNITYIS